MGTALGMWFAQRSKADESNTEKLIKIGVLGAVIGLVVNMGAGQTVNIVSVPIQLAWTDLIWAIPVSIVASLVIVAVRLPAYYLRNWGDKRPPHVYRGTIIGALVALVAIIGVAASHVDPRLILGSGGASLHRYSKSPRSARSHHHHRYEGHRVFAVPRRWLEGWTDLPGNVHRWRCGCNLCGSRFGR